MLVGCSGVSYGLMWCIICWFSYVVICCVIWDYGDVCWFVVGVDFCCCVWRCGMFVMDGGVLIVGNWGWIFSDWCYIIGCCDSYDDGWCDCIGSCGSYGCDWFWWVGGYVSYCELCW